MKLIETLAIIAGVCFLIYLGVKKPDDWPGPVTGFLIWWVYLPIGIIVAAFIFAAFRGRKP